MLFTILGTAQDGGLPHAGCLCDHCQRARTDVTFRRLPAAAGIVAGGRRLMIDATSMFEEQNHRLWQRGVTDSQARSYGAPDAILLTHAHTGHYTGLWQLDRSVLAARAVPVFGPGKTIAFLAQNEPWKTMEHEGFIAFESLSAGDAHELLPGVHLTLHLVPHRAEWKTDTVAVVARGQQSSVLYLPDIDQWHQWDHDIADIVSKYDVAYLDGTFWDRPLHPGVPHPPVLETMDRLQHHVDTGGRIAFTHLNHSNPVVDGESDAARQVLARGFTVACEDDVVNL